MICKIWIQFNTLLHHSFSQFRISPFFPVVQEFALQQILKIRQAVQMLRPLYLFSCSGKRIADPNQGVYIFFVNPNASCRASICESLIAEGLECLRSGIDHK